MCEDTERDGRFERLMDYYDIMERREQHRRYVDGLIAMSIVIGAILAGGLLIWGMV